MDTTEQWDTAGANPETTDPPMSGDDSQASSLDDALVTDPRAFYQTLVEQIPVVTFIEPHDGKGVPTYISPQVEDLLGYTQQVWREQPDIGLRSIHPDDRSRWAEALERTDRTGEPFDLEHRMITADGRTIWVRSTARLVFDAPGRPQFWQGTMQDITESVLADQRLAESEQRYRSLFDHNPDPVYSFDLEGTLISANAALSRMTGYSIEEILGMSYTEVVVPEDMPRVREHFREAAAGTPQEYECRALRRDGSPVDIHVTNLPIVVDGEIVGVYGVAKDISQRKSLERQLKHMAFHDWLTDLPNRPLFMERLENALAGLSRRPGSIALLFIDLDTFKQVNDTFGHDVGDRALRTVARLISACIRAGDTIARMGGDEFTVLLLDVERQKEALDIAERILELLGQPIVVAGHTVSFSASIGIVLSSSPADGALDLLRRGDAAMYEAKAAGKARYKVYESSGS